MAAPRVLIGCPVRNRAWILPAYLKALEALDHPEDQLQFAFILNDCTDASAEILRGFAQQHDVRLRELNCGDDQWQRGYYSYTKLARLRNRLLEELLATDAHYLFSVDSDVLVPPHALRRLIQHHKPIVAARVPNDGHLRRRKQGQCNFLRDSPEHGRAVHVTDFPPDALIPVDITGAAVLINREVIEAGCRYHAGATGEDEGFCRHAKQLGYSIWVDTGIICRHCMVPPS
jgi:hypothetical protein